MFFFCARAAHVRARSERLRDTLHEPYREVTSLQTSQPQAVAAENAPTHSSKTMVFRSVDGGS